MEACGQLYLPYASRTDEFRIWPIADVHYGNRACSVDKWKADIEAIHDDPFSFWFGLGDLGEYISIGDKRFDPRVSGPDVDVSGLGDLGAFLCDRIFDYIHPIAHKCIGLGIGNHELKYYHLKEQLHMHGYLLKRMGRRARRAIFDLQWASMFDLVFVRTPRRKRPPCLSLEAPAKQGFTRSVVRFAVEHGTGCSRTRGAKTNKLMSMKDRYDADVYVQAHLHTPQVEPWTTVGADQACRHITAKNRLLLRTGPYLRTYAQGVLTYAERAGYESTTLGATPIHVRPDRHRIWAETGVTLSEDEPDEKEKK